MRKLAENRDGRLNQHLSVIRNTFNGILGNGDALLYTIEGTPGERFGIRLPRKFVRWTDQQGNPVPGRSPGRDVNAGERSPPAPCPAGPP